MGKENKNPIPSELKTIWHPSKNNHLDFHSIQLGTGKIVWWLGGCGHEWKAEPRKVALGTRCPYCSGLKIREGFNDIVTLNPSLAQEIHPTKNDNLNKNTLSPGSHKKIWWLGNCGHEWKSKVKGRHEKKYGCPYCSGHYILVGFNDLKTTDPVLAKEWHPTKNNKTTEEVKRGMRTHAWWLGKCGHEWAAPINNRAGLKNGCPYCKNKKVLVGTNDLRTINPLLATEWHPILNKINPEDVFSGTKTKVWWLGICGHEWQASVASRQKMKSGCPKCASGKNVSKAEKEIFNYIQSLTTFLVDSSNRTAIRPQELDIYIPEKKLAIEFNGTYWHSAELGRCSQDYHFKKWQLCEQKNIKLIQIWEDDYNVNPSLIKEKIKSLFSPQIVLEDYTTETKDEGKIEFYSSTEIKIASFNFRMEDEVLYTSSPVLSSGYFCVDWVVLLEGYAQENNVKQVSINLDNDWSSDISYLRDKGFEICTVQPPTSRKTQKGYTVFNSGMTILSKFF